MLAAPVDLKQVPDYCLDDNFNIDQKVDGVRKIVQVVNQGVTVYGRDGQLGTLPQIEEFRRKGVWAFDGELVDNIFYIFDLPLAGDKIGIKTPYKLRRKVLDDLAPALESETVKVLPTSRTTEEKVNKVKQVFQAGGEGVMLKNILAPYEPGIRSRNILKAKFIKSADVIITRYGVDGKQNCAIGMFNDSGELVEIGTVIIHQATLDATDVGSVCEVQYLYCVDPEKPRLVQPTRLTPRFDKSANECTLDQLMFTDKKVLS